jgi:hypothetical protein
LDDSERSIPAMTETPESTSRIESKRYLDFDTSKFPPRPKAYTQVTDPNQALSITPFGIMINEQQIIALRQRAEIDERLQDALGKQHAFLSFSLTDTGDKSEAAPKHEIRLVYFNYVTNRAVHVWLSGDDLKAVQVQPEGYQPPESAEEIATAEKIVRRDTRYKEAVKGLLARGILTPAPEGRRYIYLMFKRPQEPAAFNATVDLRAGKVVKAEPIKHS